MADGSAAPFVLASSPVPAQGIGVVYFAGTGGSSEAARLALGRSPDVALNHKWQAIGVHKANHPETEHFISDVFDIDPRCVRPGQKWHWFWASPDCRDFSKAKGAAPVSPRVRGLCWIVIKVAKLLGDLAPDVIFVENVEEFVEYGPLLPPDEHGRQYRDPKHKGRSFRTFVKRLRQCGYVVEWRADWVAGEFGAATTRKRFILIARRDGKPIVWPQAWFAPRRKARAAGLRPYRPVADHIDFGRKCPSIFLTREQCREQGIKAKRPLAEATMARIAKGVERYVIAAAEPFIVPIQNWSHDRVHSVSDPARTITAFPRGGAFALVQPEVTAMAAHMTRFQTGSVGSDMRDAAPTITANSFHKRPGGCAPLGLVTAQLAPGRLVAAHMDVPYGSNLDRAGGGDLADPIGSISAGGNHHFLVQSELMLPFAQHGQELRAFLTKYYGTGAVGQALGDPMHCASTRARFGLVVVQGHLMQITDIGLRMLDADELAGAQGFPAGYRTGWNALTNEQVTQAEEIGGIGNSVSPKGAAPFIAANVGTPEDLERLRLAA